MAPALPHRRRVMTLTRYLALATVIVVPGLVISVMATPPTAERSIPAMQRPAEFLAIEVEPEPSAAPLVTWDLPVARNERVDFFIRWLSGHNRERTALWLERSGRYGPMTREKLRARGMPEDLTYLALIESGFSPGATSRAKAIGLWQFTAETGRRYGLKVTPYVDERRTTRARTVWSGSCASGRGARAAKRLCTGRSRPSFPGSRATTSR
jgi:hypothetical protein